MIKSVCDNCGEDGINDPIFCQACYYKLEIKLDNVLSDLDSANNIIIQQEKEIDKLNEIIVGLESKLNNSAIGG